MGRQSADIEQVLSLLFTHNADVNIRSLREGDTALHLAVKRFENGDAYTMALKLISLGADPGYRNDVSTDTLVMLNINGTKTDSLPCKSK